MPRKRPETREIPRVRSNQREHRHSREADAAGCGEGLEGARTADRYARNASSPNQLTPFGWLGADQPEWPTALASSYLQRRPR